MECFYIVTVGWVFSLCLHEFAHAWVAYRGGDHTIREKGYLTFNPLKYVDPFFSLVLPILFVLLGGIGLPGGAVYIDRSLLRSRVIETAVSLAGPLANFILVIILGGPCSLALRIRPPNCVSEYERHFLCALHRTFVRACDQRCLLGNRLYDQLALWRPTRIGSRWMEYLSFLGLRPISLKEASEPQRIPLG